MPVVPKKQLYDYEQWAKNNHAPQPDKHNWVYESYYKEFIRSKS